MVEGHFDLSEVRKDRQRSLTNVRYKDEILRAIVTPHHTTPQFQGSTRPKMDIYINKPGSLID